MSCKGATKGERAAATESDTTIGVHSSAGLDMEINSSGGHSRSVL